MSRAMNLSMKQADVLTACEAEKVGVSAIENLSSGGVRVVCMSVAGADRMRRKFKNQMIQGDVIRERLRPRSYSRW